MAKATKKTITPAVAEVIAITLELSEDEAKAVRDVLYKVGGHPVATRRGFAQSVYFALTEAIGHPVKVLDARGSIEFL
jgi:hypothetical protein